MLRYSPLLIVLVLISAAWSQDAATGQRTSGNTSASASNQGTQAERTALPNTFKELLRSGSWAIVEDSGQGYVLQLSDDQPDTQQMTRANAEVRYAALQHEAAQADLNRAVAANQTTPGAISADDMRRLELATERAALQHEVATQQSALSTYQITGMGEDYVALSSESQERFIPLSQIRSVSRPSRAADQQPESQVQRQAPGQTQPASQGALPGAQAPAGQ